MKELTFCALLFLASSVSGQSLVLQTISSTGEALEAADGTQMNVVIGEVAVERFEANGIVLTQGFHQIFDFSSSASDDGHHFSFTLFPNPTAGRLNLEADVDKTYHLTIYDVQGHQVFQSEYLGGRQEYELDQLTSGHYIAIISSQEKVIDQLPFQKI